MAKRRKKVTPNVRQQRAAELVIGNLKLAKPKTIGAILVEAGYTQNVATKAPASVTRSEGFRIALENAGATDSKLTKVMMEGLGATKLYGKDAEIHPDYATRHKYMETALKIKGIEDSAGQQTGNTYNTFIQQNNLDPNTPESRKLVDNTLDMLMQQTKRTAKP